MKTTEQQTLIVKNAYNLCCLQQNVKPLYQKGLHSGAYHVARRNAVYIAHHMFDIDLQLIADTLCCKLLTAQKLRDEAQIVYGRYPVQRELIDRCYEQVQNSMPVNAGMSPNTSFDNPQPRLRATVPPKMDMSILKRLGFDTELIMDKHYRDSVSHKGAIAVVLLDHGYSANWIAQKLFLQDHKTVSGYVKNHPAYLKYDDKYEETYNNVKAKLEAYFLDPQKALDEAEPVKCNHILLCMVSGPVHYYDIPTDYKPFSKYSIPHATRA